MNIENIVQNIECLINSEQMDTNKLRSLLEKYTIYKMEMDTSSYLYDQNTDGSCIDEILNKIIEYIITYTKSSLSKFNKVIDVFDNTCFPEIKQYIQYIDDSNDAELEFETLEKIEYVSRLYRWVFFEKMEEEEDYPWEECKCINVNFS